MRYIAFPELLKIHENIINTSGGAPGLRDLRALQSALMQPRLCFDQEELYPDVFSKAGALGFSLVMNHPFVDGNKRVGHAAMEIFLILNGYEISAGIDEQERIILNLASGKLTRREFTAWLKKNVSPLP